MAVEVEEPGAPSSDLAAGALEDIAQTAEEVADEQRRIARKARALAACHEHGASWAQLVDGKNATALLQLLRHSASLLACAARDLQTSLVRALVGEGLTTRQIGSRFGVSHQRISALVSRRDE